MPKACYVAVSLDASCEHMLAAMSVLVLFNLLPRSFALAVAIARRSCVLSSCMSTHVDGLPGAGTPIQNDLMELHALFDYVCPDLLGNRAAFRTHFERPITAGNDKVQAPAT